MYEYVIGKYWWVLDMIIFLSFVCVAFYKHSYICVLSIFLFKLKLFCWNSSGVFVVTLSPFSKVNFIVAKVLCVYFHINFKPLYFSLLIFVLYISF